MSPEEVLAHVPSVTEAAASDGASGAISDALKERDSRAADSELARLRAERRGELAKLRASGFATLPAELQSAAKPGGAVGRKPKGTDGSGRSDTGQGASVRGTGGANRSGSGQPVGETGSNHGSTGNAVRADSEPAREQPRGLKAAKLDPIPFPVPQAGPKKDEKKKGSWLPFPLPKAWTKDQAAGKAEELKDMWETYGEYADTWLQKKCNDPDLQIWDFTEKEMKAVMKWCLKRGQTTPAVAMALDLALEGRTDIDFAVILGGKALETGFRLSTRPRRPK